MNEPLNAEPVYHATGGGLHKLTTADGRVIMTSPDGIAWTKVPPFAPLPVTDRPQVAEELERKLLATQKELEAHEVALPIVRRDRDWAQKQLEQNNQEIGQFQNDVRSLLVGAAKEAGIEDADRIDGGGCDSGDWRDFTCSEISQGLVLFKNALDEAREKLAKALQEVEEAEVATKGSYALLKEVMALRAEVEQLKGRET